MNRRTLLLGLAALPAACAPPRVRGTMRPRSEGNSPTRVNLTGRSLAAPGEVPVLLAGASGKDEVTVEVGGASAIHLHRSGEHVLASDGQIEKEFTIHPRSAVTGLVVEGRTYPGRVLVRPRLRGGLEVFNLVDLEAYVEGVVSAELVIWSAAPAELSAQAICVRTYALSELAKRRTPGPAWLFDSVQDQAYKGRHIPGTSAKAREVASRLRHAVEATHGLVLRRRGRLEDARFHASCGGRTSNLTEVFREASGPGPMAVTCQPCASRAESERRLGSPAAKRPLGWTQVFGADELAAAAHKLGVGSRILRFAPAQIDTGNRWLAAEVTGTASTRRVPMDELRAAFGSAVFKSARITALSPRAGDPIVLGLTVHGLGRGHGVGLCQEGTRDLAIAGRDYRSILEHYYPGATLERA